MKISHNWLAEWVPLPSDVEQIAERFTMAGIEIDAIQCWGDEIHGVHIAQITAVTPHPNADKLHLCAVDDGSDQIKNVVCGAANAVVGAKVAYAKVDSVLPGGIPITRRKIRGQYSDGMLCSSAELNVSGSDDGIVILDQSAPIGESLKKYLQLNDRILDVSITPNRGDCLSVLGMAREWSALNGETLSIPPIKETASTIEDTLPIKICASHDCPCYLGRVIKGVNMEALLPIAMREKLHRLGARSVNPVVDITNYVLYELGQPLHAFDLSHIDGGIVVRDAQLGESLRLLDGSQLQCDGSELLIADDHKPLAYAGVMGGAESAVSAQTTDIFLESAFFLPPRIAHRQGRMVLNSEAAYRYERGVDYRLPQRAMERATQLIIDCLGGHAGPIAYAVDKENLPTVADIQFPPHDIQRLLGFTIPVKQARQFLVHLGMEVKDTDTNNTWSIQVPSHRFDVRNSADIVEEIVRLYGYQNVPTRLPKAAVRYTAHKQERWDDTARQYFIAQGYQEVVTYSFVCPQLLHQLNPHHPPPMLLNPLSDDTAAMRTTLWAGLLQVLCHNFRRQVQRMSIFEIGQCFRQEQDGQLLFDERIGLALAGLHSPESWMTDKKPADFYAIKAVVFSWLNTVYSFAPCRAVAMEHPALHPGQSARLEKDDKPIGWIGTLHPQIADALSLKIPVILAEIDRPSPTQSSGWQSNSIAISKYPEIRRDITVSDKSHVPATKIQYLLRTAAGPYLTQINLVMIYEEKNVRHLTFGLIFQHPSRTLSDVEINDTIFGIIKELKGGQQLDIRESGRHESK